MHCLLPPPPLLPLNSRNNNKKSSWLRNLGLCAILALRSFAQSKIILSFLQLLWSLYLGIFFTTVTILLYRRRIFQKREVWLKPCNYYYMVYLDVKGYIIRTQKYIQADTMHNLYVFSNHGALKAKTLINWA